MAGDVLESRGLILSAQVISVSFMDMKLELIMVPVTDVDRAKAFYEKVGFVADHDQTVSDEIRFVQLTPPGSACSIAIGKGVTEMAPGSPTTCRSSSRTSRRARRPRRAGRRGERRAGHRRGAGSSLRRSGRQPWALQQLPDWSAGAARERGAVRRMP